MEEFKQISILQSKILQLRKIIFQHLSVKEIVFKDRKIRCEEIKPFRNCDKTQHLTSVDIEEIVKSCGYTVKILQSFMCDILEFNPFERLIEDMADKRNKFKEENKTLLQILTKKVSQSVYGGCMRKVIEESYKCVAQNGMKNEYDESVIEWFALKDGNIIVKIRDKEGVDDEGLSKKFISQAWRLGSFELSHSKILMNDVILALGGFEKYKIYYGDTGSKYMHNNDYEILNTKGIFGKNIHQSKIDYGKGGILYLLFLAPKIKYCIVNDENGILSQKTTFKGYDQYMVELNLRDFFDLERGDTVLVRSKLKWKRDLYGVKIPHRVFHGPQCDNEKICKQCEISSKLNCLNVRWLKRL